MFFTLVFNFIFLCLNFIKVYTILALYSWLVGIIVFLNLSILFATSASIPVHATFMKYLSLIFPISISVSLLGRFFIVLYVSFPEPDGITPSLFFVPTNAGSTSVKVPSPPTTYITYSLSLYSNAMSYPLFSFVIYLISNSMFWFLHSFSILGMIFLLFPLPALSFTIKIIFMFNFIPSSR